MSIPNELLYAFRDIYIACLYNEYDPFSIILEINFEIDLKPTFTTPTTIYIYKLYKAFVLHIKNILNNFGYYEENRFGVIGRIRVYHKSLQGFVLERGFSTIIKSSQINVEFLNSIWLFIRNGLHDDAIYDYYWCFDIDQDLLDAFEDVCLDDETDYISSDAY